VTVTVPSGSGFQVSTNSATGFDSSATVTVSGDVNGPVGATLSGVPIYVKFAPMAKQPYSGSVTNASGGATNVLVWVDGTGQVIGGTVIIFR